MSRGQGGGRPPKPTALHQLHGTYNATRHGKGRAGEPQPEGDLAMLDPPDWLTPGQRESWDYAIRHAPKGLLKPLDAGALALWCVAEDRLRTCERMLALYNEQPGQLPYITLTPAGWRLSPYVKGSREAAQQMLAAGDRLGFSPAMRTRIYLEPRPREDPTDSWAVLRRFPVVIDGGRAADPPVAALPRRKKNGAKA